MKRSSTTSCPPVRKPGGGAHGAAIRRLIEETEPFRPGASPEELVAALAKGPERMSAFLTLYTLGEPALPAVRKNLGHPDWQVRRWCAAFIDNFADAESLRALVPLLQDPASKVRVWAVHSLSCEACKDGSNPVDAVPLLIERIELDDSVKVQRQAVAMLAHHRASDPRVLPVFKKLVAETGDRILRLLAEQGLKRSAAARHDRCSRAPEPRGRQVRRPGPLTEGGPPDHRTKTTRNAAGHEAPSQIV